MQCWHNQPNMVHDSQELSLPGGGVCDGSCWICRGGRHKGSREGGRTRWQQQAWPLRGGWGPISAHARPPARRRQLPHLIVGF